MRHTKLVKASGTKKGSRSACPKGICASIAVVSSMLAHRFATVVYASKIYLMLQPGHLYSRFSIIRANTAAACALVVFAFGKKLPSSLPFISRFAAAQLTAFLA